MCYNPICCLPMQNYSSIFLSTSGFGLLLLCPMTPQQIVNSTLTPLVGNMPARRRNRLMNIPPALLHKNPMTDTKNQINRLHSTT